MKRVLHIINRMGTGGAEKLLSDLIPLQKMREYNVELARFAPGQYDFIKKLEKHNIKIHTLGKSDKDIYNPLNIFRLKNLIKDFDIIHVHLFPAQYWAVLASILSNFKGKIITTEHSTENRRRNIFLFKILDKFIYNRFNNIISISDDTKNNLLNHIKIKTPITTITNGINIDSIEKFPKVAIKKEISLQDNDYLLCQVARFTSQKDQMTLLKSLKYLPENIKVIFVGDGNLKKDHIDFVNQNNLSKRVFFLGTRNDVYGILKDVDLAIMSSNIEGFGLSALEAMCLKVPVIASNIPGLSQIVEGAALLFEKGNEKDLASKISSLYKDKILYHNLAIKGVARAKEFDIIEMEKKYSLIYEN